MKTGYVYKITSPRNKVYIGSTINLKNRLYHYSSHNCKKQYKLYSSLKKYGFENHTIEVLEEPVLEILRQREHYYGMLYDTLSKNGLNLSLPKSNAKYESMTKDTRDKIAESHKGKKLSESHRLKIIEALKKRVVSEETRLKISTSLKGIKHSLERRRKISEGNKGKIISEHTREVLSKINSKEVLCLETGIFYDSVKEASNVLGINSNYLSRMLRGVRRNRTSMTYIKNK